MKVIEFFQEGILNKNESVILLYQAKSYFCQKKINNSARFLLFWSDTCNIQHFRKTKVNYWFLLQTNRIGHIVQMYQLIN